VLPLSHEFLVEFNEEKDLVLNVGEEIIVTD
jgi:hypothetical protein